jgi:hypothetical protein
MKMGLGKSAQFVLFIILLTTIQTIVFAGGNQDRDTETAATEVTRRLIWTSSDRPDWVDIVPQSDTEFYFVGTSQPFDTAANARDNARENARNQVLSFYGQFIERRAIESGSMSGSTRDTLEVFVVREEEIRSFAENVISQVGVDRYYTELYLNSNNQEEHIVYVLCQISRQKAEEDIANFARNISQRYAAMLTPRSTLKAMLESYVTVLRALEQNTLHRVTAYHEGAAGRVGLYGHVRAGIIDLANSISFASLQNRTIRKPDTLDTTVRLQSTLITNIGPFDCRVTISGMNMNIPAAFYSVNNNSFFMSFNTPPLENGRYAVQIELLLEELTGGIVRNINTGFSFEVMPLTSLLRTREEMEEGIKRAVDTLAAALQRQTETRIGLFTLTGTDMPTGLSRFLTERVTHYAINNPDRKYRIIRENIERDNNRVALLNGNFNRRGDQVDVTLELNTPDGNEDGSQAISITVELLTALGLTFEPENINIVIEVPPIEPANQAINIQAFFNSPSRTFLHRDELKMSVLADRNCYFKIIHIDADNQMKMIYPNSFDRNNFLRANIPRDIFETASYMLYGPYGAETILVVASSEQFRNIEQEFITPWATATAETVRNMVEENRGGDLERRRTPGTALRTGEAAYTITILKPHEEYEYARPENMREMVENLRNDVLRQGGTFEGNETSGVYIVNNIRGSYRIPRETPDRIQFAIYYLDNFTGGRNAGVQTRGRGFNFSFTRPADMRQAVQSVRLGIEENGGTFSGNEQQGNFRASGITGQYRVADMVNVTITEKPFVVPNALIEREVRNFFGGR